MSIFHKVLTAVFLISLASVVKAGVRIDVVIAPGNEAVAQLAANAREQLLKLPTVDAVNILTATDGQPRGHGDLAIAIGDATLSWLLSSGNFYKARLAFYVESENFRRAAGSRQNLSAIYRDQPLDRQLQLAKLLLPRLRKVAVIHRLQKSPDLAELARVTGLSINNTAVSPGFNWAKALSALLSENDMLLAVDDFLLYNRDTIRSILLTTYRHGKVVIGPSQAFVNAGSLASCYTTMEQFLRQLHGSVEFWLRSGSLPAPAHGTHYRIAINRQVATSLGLDIPDHAFLIRTMQSGGECDNEC